jgi:RNA polymerase sigma-70 factor (ECF subfamily)
VHVVLEASAPQGGDVSLVAALRRGDEATFAAVVSRYQPTLTRLAMLYVRDRAVAEDVVQEAWLGCLRGLDTFEGRASLKTWLCRIVANRARTRAVREGRSITFSELVGREVQGSDPAVDPSRFRDSTDARWPGHWQLPPSAEDLPEQRMLASELTERVREAVASLPPAQREVVSLRDIDGWTADEVCHALDLSEANQRVLLHRGRSKVRAALETYLAHARVDPAT